VSQEKLKILEMIQNKTITPKEGAELLKAIEEKNAPPAPKKEAFRMFKIRVKSSDGDKVNVQIPLEFARMALKSKKGIPKLDEVDADIDFDQLLDLIDSGTVGKLVDIESDDGDIVEIYIE